MKVFAVLVLFLACLVPARADTTVQTWTVTANCDANINPNAPCTDPAIISATFTTQMETGTWPCPMCDTGFQFTGTVPVVTDISGTFDGQAMTLMGDTGWMAMFNPQEGLPQDVFFSTGGATYELLWDVFFILKPNTAPDEYLDLSAPDPVPSPEPATALLLTVPLLLGLSKWAQMSLRKSTAH